jgi:hypothetical protein
MKPANFPARKDSRRFRTMVRLIEQEPVKDGMTKAERLAAAGALQLRLNPGARDVRTKKLRGQRRGAA